MKILISCLLALCLLSFPATAAPPTTYQQAAQLANKEHKLLFVFFYTDICHWCHQMATTTLVDRDIRGLFSQYFVVYYLNADKEQRVVTAYRPYMRGYPTYCFVSFRNLGKPVMIASSAGCKDLNDFVNWYNNDVGQK